MKQRKYAKAIRALENERLRVIGKYTLELADKGFGLEAVRHRHAKDINEAIEILSQGPKAMKEIREEIDRIFHESVIQDIQNTDVKDMTVPFSIVERIIDLIPTPKED